MEEQRRAERLVINLRWIVLAAGVLMLERAVSLHVLLGGAALIVAYNLGALATVSNSEAYRRRGLTMAAVTRAGDMIAASLAVCTVQSWSSGSHLLFLFPIIATGYVFGRKDAALGVVSAAAALNVAVSILDRGWDQVTVRTLGALLGQTVVFALGGLVGLTLRSYRAREEVQEDHEVKLDSLVRLQDLSAAIRPSEVLRHVAEVALHGTGAQRAAVLLKTTDGHALYVKAAASADGVGGEVAADDPVALQVTRTGQALVVSPTSTPLGQPGPDGDAAVEPSACVPLVHHSTTTSKHVGEVLGVLLVRGKLNSATFGDSDLSLLRSLASGAALVYVNTTLYDRLYEAFLGTMRSLARSLEARDPYTQGHSFRVAAIATRLAREMALDTRSIDLLRDAALLHDIGKIGIPDGILRKPTDLTPDEWASIKSHPAISEEICQPLDLPRDVLFLIRHHQERLDGSGYPDGLQSHQQPLALRILCVADAFDAMSSDRPYRGALTPETRLRELNRLAGVEFDQQVVETLKHLIGRGALDDLYRETSPGDITPPEDASLPESTLWAEAEDEKHPPVSTAAE